MPSALRIKELRNLSDTVLMSDGALSSNVQFPAGTVIGYQRDTNNNVQTLTGNYPNNAQPTSSGGNLVCSVTHTAKANSKLLLHTIIYASESSNTGDQVAVAFFKDTTFIGMHYLQATDYGGAAHATQINCFNCNLEHTPADTSSHVYSVRIGLNGSGSLILNDSTRGYSVHTQFGNSDSSKTFHEGCSLTLMEIAQ